MIVSWYFRASLLSVMLIAVTDLCLPCRAIAQPSQAAAMQTIVIDGNGAGPVFEGLGAVSAGASSRLLVDYAEPQRSQILDYLFKPGYGASLQHLKVEIGSDVNSTDGSEPSHMRSANDHDYERGYEWWLMAEARKRNPNIILDSLPWGAPGWIGNGRLYSEDMANYVADFIEGARTKYGLNIAYTGVWNERVYDGTYVKELHDALLGRGLPTKIVCCDEYPGEGIGQWQIVEAMQQDKKLDTSVSVVSVHYPWVYNSSTTPRVAKMLGKPLWSSEDQPNDGGGPILSREWNIGGRLLAKLYNRNYLEGGFTKTEIWSPITSYYDNLAAPGSGLMYANTPWSGSYKVQGAIWATAHTTQFAQPGWHYDDSACGYLARGGSFVTFTSPDKKDWSSVLESIDAVQPQKVQLKVIGSMASHVVHVWETNSSKTFVHIADIQPKGGTLSLTIDPGSLYSLTTTTGQGRGDAVSRAAAPFPLPYDDDFDEEPIARAARYLADQDGAFEVHPCRMRSGRCLEQVITAIPIPWSPIPDPFTMAGDSNWKDYRVTVDTQIPNTGAATIFGRIDSANAFEEHGAEFPSGYGLSLTSSGNWSLLSTAYKRPKIVLASGALPLMSKEWHHLELSFHGANITASIDGSITAQVADSSHRNGMFSLGSNWTTVQYDNLRIVK